MKETLNDKPIYFRGYQALELEKKKLEERVDDRIFISGLLELEYKIEQIKEDLSKLFQDKEKLSIVLFIKKAQLPRSPIKPKSKLIIIISTILGFMLSLFIVFILNIIQAYKDKQKLKNDPETIE